MSRAVTHNAAELPGRTIGRPIAAGLDADTADGRAAPDCDADDQESHKPDGDLPAVRNGVAERQTDNRASTSAKAATPPPLPPASLPLDSDEAELCARLRDVLAKPPKRQRLEIVPPPHIGVKPAPTPPEVVAEPAPLPPLVELPRDEMGSGAPGVARVVWLQRSRRRRLSAAIGATPAWAVTFGVIGVTLAAALVTAVGMDRSIDFSQRALSASSSALIAMRSVVGL